MQNAFIMFTTADFILFLKNLPVALRGKPRERYSLLFMAEKRSAQVSAHPLSQAQGGLFCVLTMLTVFDSLFVCP